SRDGKVLAVGGAPSRTLSVATGQEIARVGETHNGGVQAVALSPDGKVMAEASQLGIVRGSGRIILWDTAGREMRRLEASRAGWYNCLAFSPDGRIVAAGARPTGFDQGGLLQWDRETGTELRRIGAPGQIDCIAFSPDGRTIAAGTNGE